MDMFYSSGEVHISEAKEKLASLKTTFLLPLVMMLPDKSQHCAFTLSLSTTVRTIPPRQQEQENEEQMKT